MTFHLTKKDFNDIDFLKSQTQSFTKVILGNYIFKAERLREKLFLILNIVSNDGILKINKEISQRDHGFWGRSDSQIRYLISNISNGSFILEKEDSNNMIFKKVRKIRSYKSNFEGGLTLGYITDGKNLNIIIRTLKVIESMKKRFPLEVLICGPNSIRKEFDAFSSVICIDDYSHTDIRPPITVKKNRITKSALYENIILAHDRFFFDDVFFEQLIAYGNNFDIYNCKRCDLNFYPNQKRVHGDYVSFNFPIDSYSGLRAFKDISFGKSNPDIFLNGGFLMGKREIFEKVPLNENLFWGDLEDVHFSVELKLNGFVIFNDFNNRCFTDTKRLGQVNTGFKNILRGLLNIFQLSVFKILKGKSKID